MNDGHLPKVGIVILNWNNYNDTSRCLKSLGGLDYNSYTIYLVDNDSTDGSREKLKAEFGMRKEVSLITNRENLGFAAGCNPGITLAVKDGCEYILLLNNDCIIYDKGFLLRGVELGESDERYGIIGGKILFWPDVSKIWSTGGYISYLGAETHIGHGEIDRGQYERVERRKFISGAMMLIKRAVVEKIGLLPEAYFFGKEEWEYSTRAVKAGFILMYNPTFSVYHEASHSHDGADPTYIYNSTLSKALYKKRNLSSAQYFMWRTLYSIYLRWFFAMRYSLLRGRYIQGIEPHIIQGAMRLALRDATAVQKITNRTLDVFRHEHLPRMLGEGVDDK